jgi:Xaa-Pro dipeptidase
VRTVPTAATVPITATEYRARQRVAAQRAAERDYVAVVAWSRGGSTQDSYADALWLSGFYTHYPVLADEPGRWRARGHTAVVVPAEGPSTAIVDVTQRGEREAVADAVVLTGDVVDALAMAIADTVPAGRVALVGGQALAERWASTLRMRLPRHVLVEDDQLLDEPRAIKSPAEQALLRAAGAVGTRAVQDALDAAAPGVHENELAAIAIGRIVEAGGALYGLGLSSGPWSHTFAPITPAAYRTRALEAGDLVRLDIYGSIEGYLFDFGRSRVVGDEIDPAQRELLVALSDSVDAGVELLVPGTPLAEVARRCTETFDASDYVTRHGSPPSPLGSWGHGLGLAFERPWIEERATATVRAGMCLAVERRIEAPGLGGANYEQNVLVTDTGPEILTPARIYH